NLLNNEKNEDKEVRYSDFRAPRLTKILPHTRFVNPVHECFNTYGKNVKVFDDYVIHYGYSFANDTKEANDKFKRNAELLLKRYNNGERNGMFYLQLFETFAAAESEAADKYLEEGIEYCKKNKDKMLAPLLGKKVAGFYRRKKFVEALAVCDEYSKLDKVFHSTVLATDVDIVAAQALSLTHLEHHEEAIKSYIKFFTLFNDFESNKISSFDVFCTSRNFARQDNFMAVLYMFLKSCLKSERYDTAYEFLSTLPVDKYSIITHQVQDLITLEMKLLANYGYEKAYPLYMRFDIKDREMFKNALINKLGSENSSVICDALIEICRDDKSFCSVINTLKRFFDGEGISSEKFKEITEKSDLPILLYVGLSSRSDISPLLLSEKFDIKTAVVYGYKFIKDFHNAAENYSSDLIRDREKNEAFAEFVISVMAGAITVKRIGGGFCVRSIDKLFELYASIDTEKCLLAREIVVSRKTGDYRTCIAKMREFIEAYPEFAAVISEYRKSVLVEYESLQPKDEMQQLIAMIKSNIRNYIASGNIKSAEKTLAEYEKINPSDPDIPELKSKLI
ncbi:MAG: hypothetical protein IJX15_03560, partial [Ruminiclostridium sp.]|nr:hypothetical protein [Ruminiclostridium sp.]